jgi:hypothetical protein
MLGSLLVFAATAAAASPELPSTPANPQVEAAAAQMLFERDWVLMNWALKFYDNDHNILLSPSEAEAAAVEFRKMADADNDGRVTPQEYRAARAFILARY